MCQRDVRFQTSRRKLRGLKWIRAEMTLNFRVIADHSPPATANWIERWEHVFLCRAESSHRHRLRRISLDAEVS